MAHSPPPVTLVPSSSTGRDALSDWLTGGSDTTESTDVTYITPYFWLEERFEEVFQGYFLYPIVDF